MQVQVFSWRQIPNPSKNAPLDYLEMDEAIWLVEQGFAEWRNHRKAIHLRPDAFEIRGRSTKPDAAMMQAYSAGKPWAVEAISGWKFVAPIVMWTKSELEAAPSWL